MVVLGCLPVSVLPLLSFSAAVQAPKHYHSTGLVAKYVDNNLGKHLSPSALFKRSSRVSALAVNTTAKERIAKRFLHIPPEHADFHNKVKLGMLVTDKTDITPDDSNASIPSTVSGSDVEEGQSTHKMTAEMPPGSPNGNVMQTRKETAMIEKTSLSAFTSATEGTVNHDNARYSDNVLLPADDTPEALTKSSLSLKLNKLILAVMMMLSTTHSSRFITSVNLLLMYLGARDMKRPVQIILVK